MSIYILCHAEQEAKRLLRLKNWARPQGNEEKYTDEDRLAFHKIKRNLIVGYWIFLVISALGLLLHGAALYKRLLT